MLRKVYLISLVTKEMNLLEPLVHYVSQRIRFVPSMREDIKRYLASDRVCQAVIGKLFPKNLHERRSDAVFLKRAIKEDAVSCCSGASLYRMPQNRVVLVFCPWFGSSS